jgi:ABC-type nitrate/sulfonate/bicarbonate transport system permease component
MAVSTLNPSRTKIWALRAALLAVIVGAWLFGTGPGDISPLILPTVPAVFEEFFALFTSSFVLEATFVTVSEVILAFVLAAAIGLLAGFLLSRTALRAQAAEPPLAWAYMFPFILLYPLFLLWMGVGVPSKIAYAALAAAIPIAYNTLRGLRTVDRRFTTVGTAFGASPVQMDLHVKIGAARPMILSGIRIGISVVLISVILAELLGSNVGLGFELQRASSTMQNARSFALIILLIVVTTSMQWGLEKAVAPRRRKRNGIASPASPATTQGES